MSALQDRAMLVNVSISSWTASKKDNKASDSIKAQAAATAKAGWFNKRLVDPVALQPINKVEGRIRDFHYRFTLPWGDNGDRVLPGAAYMDYMDGLRKLKEEFEYEVVKFVNDYPIHVQNARTILGKMYDPADYPSPASIRQRFEVRHSFSPVPSAADFRVDVGAEAVEEIKKNIEENANARMQGAVRECWDRMYEAVWAMHERLSDPDAVFRDSLVENLRTLLGILPKLNITNDGKLNASIANVRNWLLIEPDSLRRDKKLRAFTADKAGEIAQEVYPWTSISQTM